ncbi:MAG: PAS domain-containing protein [Proteobacteria bacterium]|nr:PAS domain-containing protein [Pseudomonadota bacterium]
MQDDENFGAQYIEVVQDITECKLAGEAVKESEDKYRTLIEHIPAITYIAALDEFSKTIFVSSQISKILGIFPEDYERDSDFWVNHLHNEDRERVLAEVGRAHEKDGHFLSEYRMISMDGRIVWFRDEAVIIMDEKGDPLYLQGVMVDITERKQAEDRLKTLHDLALELSAAVGLDETSRLCVEAAIQNTALDSGGIYLVNELTGELYLIYSERLSPDFVATTSHYTADAPSTRLVMDGQPIYADYSRLAVPMDKARRNEGLHCVAIIPIQHQNKSIGCLNIASHSVDSVTAVDRTMLETLATLIGSFIARAQEEERRKRAEEVRVQLASQLRQQQKLEAIGTLAGGVAHEINNPIHGIMNYAQLISDKLAPKSPLRLFADGIGEETERVAKIVRNLLAFARQDKESHSPARINDIVDNTLSLINTIIRRDQITLDVDMPDNLPRIKCRSQQIQQVLMNLLTNARDALNERYTDYNPDKRMIVTVRPFEMESRKWIRTTVEDHGAGIPDDIRARLFDPFYSTKDRTKGTGLGLSISLGIVQDHHGKLSFECEQDKHTRFHLDLLIDNGWSLGETPKGVE